MKILEMTLPPKKPMQKITTPREQPVAIAVRKPFHARSFFPAPVFCATNADTDCITEDGISMMNEVSFCATPYPADGIRPMPLMIELITRKEICTVVSCNAIGTPTFRTFFSSSRSMRQSSFLNSIGRLPFFNTPMEAMTEISCARTVASAAPATSSFSTPTKNRSPAILAAQAMPTNKSGRFALPIPRSTLLMTLYAMMIRIPPEQIRR